MVQRPLQLVAAVLLVVGVLGVSSALISEVREAVLEASPSEPRIDYRPPTSSQSGLPIHEFTLLDPASALVPMRETSGLEVVLTGNGTLELDRGDAIQVAPIGLPVGATARFPEGGVVDGNRIRCPAGCVLETPQRTIRALPNATLVLPGQGTPPIPDVIEPGTRIEVPAGTTLELDAIEMEAATTLPLLAGTRIELPPRADPPPPARDATRLELPAGTTVRGEDNRSATPRDLEDVARSGPQIDALEPDEPSTLRPEVTVTRVPDVIEKGQPFQVHGTVELPNGTPLAGHPVTLYANATKPEPGFEIQIGAVATDEEGLFRATARIETSRPTQPYHLLAKAHARPEHDPPLSEAWSDPLVPVEGKAELTLELPDRVGVRVPIPLQVQLTDTYGAPIPNRSVTASIEGTGWIGQAVTGDDGRATIVARDGLPTSGNWTVTARFDGTQHIAPARTETFVEGVDSRIVTDATLVLPRGTQTNLTGRVLHGSQPAADQRVLARMDGIRTSTLTLSDGTFRLPIQVPPDADLGNDTLRLRTVEPTATRTVVVTVTGQLSLVTDVPEALPQGGTLPLEVHARAERGDAHAGVPVEAHLSTGPVRRAVTDADGRAILPIPLDEPRLEVTLSSEGTPLLAPTTRTLTLSPSPLRVAGQLDATIGTPANTTLTLHAGAVPLGDEPVRLTGGGIDVLARTDADGSVRLSLAAPADTGPGRYQARLDLPRFNLARNVPLSVLEPTRLSVEILDEGTDGEPVRLRAEVHGSSGPLPDVPVTVTSEGPFTARASGFTGANGTTVLTLARPSDAEGTAALTVRAERTDSTTSSVEITSTQVTPAPFPWWTLLGLIPVGIAAAAYWRHRVEPPAAPEPTGPRIDLTLADTPEAWPPVWHPGEPATLSIRLVDEDSRALPERTLSIEGPRGARRIETTDDGTARLRLPPHEAGRHTYRVRFEGDRENAAAEAAVELRIVDYREEIDREYRALRAEASRAGLCGSDATPRELARALGGTPVTRRLARLFERCDYSPRPVRRTHYERFMKAKEACRPDGGQGPA